MSLTQFKSLHIHFYKFIDHRSKINIILHQINKFNIP
jgi:hypothetical protein